MAVRVLDLVFAGESESLELKTTIRDPSFLAKLISSFANAQGGKILIGVKEPPEVIGVDEERTRKVYESALQRLEPRPQTKLTFEQAEGRSVAVVEVARSEHVVLAEGSAFARSGAMTQPMAWTQMLRHLPDKPSPSTLESLTKAIERQSKMIEEMHEQIRKSNSWQAKWKERGFGFLLGIGASIIASVVYARF